MITCRKAKIIDRTFFVVVECPYCEEKLIFDVNEHINKQQVEMFCDVCDAKFKVSLFEYFSQVN